MMKRRRNFWILGLALLIGIGASGCGETTFDDIVDNQTDPKDPVDPVDPPTDPDDPPTEPFISNLSMVFEVTGNNDGPQSEWSSGPIPNVDTILKVRIKARSEGYVNHPDYMNFSINPGCMSFYVGIKDATDEDATAVTQVTPVLRAINGNSYWCEFAAQSPQGSFGVADEAIHDFSAYIVGQGGPFEVIVSNARYDWYCQYFGFGFCVPTPLRPVYDTHLVSGEIDIQTNVQ